IERGLVSWRKILRSIGMGDSAMCLKNFGVKIRWDSVILVWLGCLGSNHRSQSSKIEIIPPRSRGVECFSWTVLDEEDSRKSWSRTRESVPLTPPVPRA